MSIISSDNIQIKYLIQLKYRASSILNKKKSKFGPTNILDSNSESCWNSDQVLSNNTSYRVIISGYYSILKIL